MAALAVAVAAEAWAITPLSYTHTMALRSGALLGAAKACGVSDKRVSAVKRTVLGLIRLSAFDAPEAQQAARELDQRARRAMASTRQQGQNACPAVVEAFERAERN